MQSYEKKNPINTELNYINVLHIKLSPFHAFPLSTFKTYTRSSYTQARTTLHHTTTTVFII